MTRSIEDMRADQMNAEKPCPHGAMRRRAGISKTHKPYAGWFCPEDRCSPEWADIHDVIGAALAAWATASPPG